MTQSQELETDDRPAARLSAVLENISQAAEKSGRDPKAIKLIAVGKTFSPEKMIPVIEAGQLLFGENRIQEAKAKWPALKEKYPELELHLIGPMQSNKVKDAVALFDVIHTIDRPKIARAVAGEMASAGRKPKLLIQVNTGEEPQKSGVTPADCSDFLDLCQGELKLDIIGLMCIPPIGEEAALHFALLEKLSKELGLKELSMGMSSDYEKAIMFGATYVRVGTSIFGSRN